MEVYAGFLEHTDVQYGKIVDELEAQGILRNKIPLNSATMLLVAPKLYYFLNCATAYSVVTNVDMHYFALNKTAHYFPLVLW